MTPPPVPGTVVVVDDDHEMRSTLKDLLTDEGFEVVTAGNGIEALALMRAARRPCVALVDLWMPIMDGLELVEALKNDELARMPVIVMSGSRTMFVAGIEHVLQKPYDFDHLLSLVRAYCR